MALIIKDRGVLYTLCGWIKQIKNLINLIKFFLAYVLIKIDQERVIAKCLLSLLI